MKFTVAQVPSFYQGYIRNVLERDLIPSLYESGEEFASTCEGLSESQSLFRYEMGKWSIKDMIQHLIDSERIFAYRAMRFARNDQTELAGFDQDSYVKAVFADKFSLKDLINSFRNTRQSTLDLFSSLSESELARSGFSNGVEMSAEMIGFIIAGHLIHHRNVIKSKYL